MTSGVFTELNELIDLRQTAKRRPQTLKTRAKISGNHNSKVRGRGMDFSETRHYQAGDEIRHMEWRITARTGRPHVKLYEESKERPVILFVDFNPSMIFGTRIAFKSVVAARLAASLAWTTVKQGDKVGGFFFSATEHNEFAPKRRESAVLPLLASLCHYTKEAYISRNKAARKLSDALLRAHRVVRPGSILILISDFYSFDKESEHHLLRLHAHNDILAYRIVDPMELNVPKPQLYPITDGVQECLLDTRNLGICKTYEHYCQERTEQLQDKFQSLQIHLEEVSAKTSLSHLAAGLITGGRRG